MVTEDSEERYEESESDGRARTTFWEGAAIVFASMCFTIGFVWLIWNLFHFAFWAITLEERVSDLERWRPNDSTIMPGITCNQEWDEEKRLITVNCE